MMVHAGCVLVAGIRLSRTGTRGSFESVLWKECVHRLGISLYSHLKESQGEESEPMLHLRKKFPQLDGPKQGRTCDAAYAGLKPVHHQLSYSGPSEGERVAEICL